MCDGLEIEAGGSQTGRDTIVTVQLRAEEGFSDDMGKEGEAVETGDILEVESEVFLIHSSFPRTYQPRKKIG